MANARMVVLGLVAGGAAALGAPGAGLWPLHVAALVAASFVCQSVASAAQVAVFAGAFALHGVALFVGAAGWGSEVPLAAGAAYAAALVLPLVLWSRLAAPRLRGLVALFAATLAFGGLAQEAVDRLQLPFATAALLVEAPRLAAGARLAGVPGLSGIVLAWAVTLAAAVRDRRWRSAACAALGPLALLFALDGIARLTAPEPGRALRVGVVQPDVARTFYLHQMFNPRLRHAFDAQLAAQLASLRGAELVVTPEEFDDRFHLQLRPSLERWRDEARALDAALLVSAPIATPAGRENAVGAFDARGTLLGIHRKAALAPFGETAHVAGAGHAPLAPGLPLGVLVCLESALAAPAEQTVRAGAQLLVAVTDDLSFGSSPLGALHLAMTRLRAIETGRALVWASNGGPSGSVDRFGDFRAGAPFRAPGAARLAVQLHADATPWLRLGAARLFAFGLLLGAALGWRRRDTRAPPDRAPPRLRAATVALLGLVGLLALAAPTAVVEARLGAPARALRALVEPFSASPPQADMDALAEYLPREGNEAAAAAAFLLGECGLYETARALAALVPRGADPAAMQAALEAYAGLATALVAPGAAPALVPFLVATRDGRWLAAARHADTCLAYDPRRGGQARLPCSELFAGAATLVVPAGAAVVAGNPGAINRE